MDSTGSYTATRVSTSATMNPKHSYGVGDVIVAGLDESVDFGTPVQRRIRPTTSSSWKIQDLISPVGTKVYYSYYANINKSFRNEFKEEGGFTFAVPDVYFASPNFTLNLSVSGPR